jgi:hypothetical protein
MAKRQQARKSMMDIQKYMDTKNMSGVKGAYEPVPLVKLPPLKNTIMELSTPLACCVVNTSFSVEQIAVLLQTPVDDAGAIDEVWMIADGCGLYHAPATDEHAPFVATMSGKHIRRVGKGTLHMQQVQHAGEQCARITLHWRGEQYPVCIVMNENPEQCPETSMMHSVYMFGIEDVQDATLREFLSVSVLEKWRASVSLVESRSACTDTHMRITALPVPSSAAQIMPYAVAGKKHSTVSNSLRRITRISGGAETGMHIVDGKQKKTYADIEIRILPQGRNSTGRTAQIRLPSEWIENSERLQGLQGTGKENEIPELVLSEMAYLFGAKNLMPAIATLGIIAQRGHVTLAPDGELPDELRREVMAMTGNPPAKTNKDTKDRYVKLMHALRWMQIEVKTKEKGKGTRMGYRPLLQVSEYADKENEQARKVNVNTSIVHGVVPMPNALLGVTEADDPSGIMRALGAMVVMRIALSSSDMTRLNKPEKLSKALERAGLGIWWTDSMRKDGALALRTQIDDAIKKLRGVAFMDGKQQHMADVIGSTYVMWDEKAKGVNVLASARICFGVPPWMQPAHPALPAGST